MGKRLAQEFRVYALDLRNHGQSPHSALMTYPVMAGDIGEFIAAQGLAPPYLLSHSMVGKVAMQFALQAPESVAKLAVVDIAPKAYPPIHRPLLLALRALDLPAYESFGVINAVLADAIPDAALRNFLMKNLTRDAKRTFRWRIALDEIIQNYEALTHAIAVDERFAKPACFIRASRSDFIDDGDLAEIHTVFPQAEMRTIAGADHWLHIDAADEFYAIARGFFAQENAGAAE
jgi:esterase